MDPSPRGPRTELDLLDFPRLQLSKHISLVNWGQMPSGQGGEQIDWEDVMMLHVVSHWGKAPQNHQERRPHT